VPSQTIVGPPASDTGRGRSPGLTVTATVNCANR